MNYIIFPLGNFGKKYSDTRHNAGRILINNLKNNSDFKNIIDNNQAEIYIPDCYMNESGKYLRDYLKNKKTEIENIIIVYDDKDIPIGEVRLAYDRGDGGHNGLKNIIENLNTTQFYRIRVGIAPIGTGKDGLVPPHGSWVQKYVLANLTKEEKDILDSKEVKDRVIFLLEQIFSKKAI